MKWLAGAPESQLARCVASPEDPERGCARRSLPLDPQGLRLDPRAYPEINGGSLGTGHLMVRFRGTDELEQQSHDQVRGATTLRRRLFINEAEPLAGLWYARNLYQPRLLLRSRCGLRRSWRLLRVCFWSLLCLAFLFLGCVALSLLFHHSTPFSAAW